MGITGVKTVGLWDLDAERPGERDVQLAHLHRLSSWMLILGTVRLLCMLGDYARSYAEISRGALISLPAVSRFVQTNPPAVLLGFAWPLMLGLILRRTRLWIFLPAAAVTFFILSLGGWLTLVAGFWMTADSHIAFGSFEVFRGNLFQFRPGALAKAIMGLTQLMLELGTAVSAWNLARRMRSTVSTQTAGAGSGAMASANGAGKPDGESAAHFQEALAGPPGDLRFACVSGAQCTVPRLVGLHRGAQPVSPGARVRAQERYGSLPRTRVPQAIPPMCGALWSSRKH